MYMHANCPVAQWVAGHQSTPGNGPTAATRRLLVRPGEAKALKAHSTEMVLEHVDGCSIHE